MYSLHKLAAAATLAAISLARRLVQTLGDIFPTTLGKRTFGGRQPMKRSLLAAVVGLVFASALPCAQARAHAHLSKASPPVGGIVASSPARIALTFSEAVEPRFSGVSLEDAAGRPAALGAPSLDAADHATLVVPVKGRLAPGTYTVRWHAVSVDTHRTQGSFTFEVKP
jgi:methionine-rich copper-binding protein CopC